ncbi:MAG TPA: helix-turn-helix domain-containing protein [Lentimicrobium sp.]|nr:helix-turn-helix domain-containing protein [Lentimicrobium sp.]
MLIYLTLIGIFLSILLLCFSSAKSKASIYLSLFFFTLSFYGWIQWVTLYSGNKLLLAIFYTNFGWLAYMEGPLLYWYIRSILNDDPKLKKGDVFHILPMVIFFLTALPYIFTDFSYKLDIADKIVNNTSYLAIAKPTLLYDLLPTELIFLSRPLLLFAYCFYSLVLFVSTVQKEKDSVFEKQLRFMSQWITALFGFLTVLVVSHLSLIMISFEMRDEEVFFTLNVLQIMSAIGLTGLLLSPFFFPGILYGMPRFPEYDMSQIRVAPLIRVTQQMNESEKKLHEEHQKKIQFNLEADYLKQIELKVEQCMDEHAPYLHSDFNLPQLSVLLKLPVHHLSYYFREVRKETFNDFRNKRRINYAKKLIAEGKANGLTLEAIGVLSGFITRNTFFTAFKKFEGISPGTYVERTEKTQRI